MENLTVHDCGIDWLTMTWEAGHKEYVRALTLIQGEMALTQTTDEPITAATFQGYIGKKQGKLFIGERHDGMCVRVSGRRARWIAKVLKDAKASGKTTRVDFQTTAKTGEPIERYLSKVHSCVQRSNERSAERARYNVAAYKNRGRDCGLAVGARSSERYLRIYNKTLEQGGRVEPNLVRYESEYKGKRARQAWAMYCRSAQEYYLCAAIVRGDMQSIGVDMEWMLIREQVEFASTYEGTTTEKQLAWLEKFVKKTVLQLVSKVGRDEVLRALGLDE